MFELATMAANRAQGLQLSNANVDHGHTVHEKVHKLINMWHENIILSQYLCI